jgi:hypothetical protein
MSSGHHPTCQLCHSSTAEGYRCYILRTIFLRTSAPLVGFIGSSLPHATVRRREVGCPAVGPFRLHSASPTPRLPGSSWAILVAVLCELGLSVRHDAYFAAAPCIAATASASPRKAASV